MDYIVIFDVIVAFLGLYLIVSAYKMKKTGELNTVMVNSSEISDCRDKQGFIEGIYRQTTVFGGISLAFGILGSINDAVFSFGRLFDIGGVLVFLAAWLWFSRELRKEKAKYF